MKITYESAGTKTIIRYSHRDQKRAREVLRRAMIKEHPNVSPRRFKYSE